MDNDGITILGATNSPWNLDLSVRRRFEKRIYVPLPKMISRLEIIKKSLEKIPYYLEDEELQQIAEMTEGYTCSDLTCLVREVSFPYYRQACSSRTFKIVDQLPNGDPIYEPCSTTDLDKIEKDLNEIQPNQLNLPKLRFDDFEKVISKFKPCGYPEDLKKEEEFTKDFGSDS